MVKHVVWMIAFVALGCGGSPSTPDTASQAVVESAPTWPAYPPGDALQVRQNIRVVYGVGADNARQGVGEGLFFVKRLVGNYDDAGIAPDQRTIVAVLYNESAYWLLNENAWTRTKPNGGLAGDANPNAALVQELLDRGVRVEICGTTMKKNGWTKEDLLEGVVVVPGAYARLVDLQHMGFAHIAFD